MEAARYRHVPTDDWKLSKREMSVFPFATNFWLWDNILVLCGWKQLHKMRGGKYQFACKSTEERTLLQWIWEGKIIFFSLQTQSWISKIPKGSYFSSLCVCTLYIYMYVCGGGGKRSAQYVRKVCTRKLAQMYKHSCPHQHKQILQTDTFLHLSLSLTHTHRIPPTLPKA